MLFARPTPDGKIHPSVDVSGVMEILFKKGDVLTPCVTVLS